MKSVTYAVDARTLQERFPGIGRYVSNLLRALVPQLTEYERLVYLCSAEQRAGLALVEGERVSWIETEVSPFGLAQQWQLRGLLQAHAVGVYHSPYYLMPYWPGVPTVLTVYDLIPMRFPEVVSPQARLLFGITTGLAVKRADHVISISDATRTDFLSHFSIAPDRISTTPLAASGKFHPVAPQRVIEMRRKYGLTGPYVLYVGSNKPHKNLARLVGAWASVLKHVAPPRTLVLAGRRDARYGQEEQEIARLRLANQVRLLPDIADDDLPSLYSGAELFVFPSIYEGFGLPVLEAMSCGCAVACADRSSLPEIVNDSAILFDPNDVTDIARAITLLLGDLQTRRAFQGKALQRAAAFSWEHTAEATLAIYRQTANLYPVYTSQL